MTQRDRQHKVNQKKLSAVKDQLRDHVNAFLVQNDVPVFVDSMQFTNEEPPKDGDFKCCTINGKHVCGPQCH